MTRDQIIAAMKAARDKLVDIYYNEGKYGNREFEDIMNNLSEAISIIEKEGVSHEPNS